MLQNSGNVDNLTGHYVFFLGCGDCGGAVAQCSALTAVCARRAYRALYLLNWIYRYFHEPGYRHWIGASHAVRAPALVRRPEAAAAARSVDIRHCANYFLLRLLLLLPEELEEQRAAIAPGLSRAGQRQRVRSRAADAKTTNGIRINRGYCRCQLRRVPAPRRKQGAPQANNGATLLTSSRPATFGAAAGRRHHLPFTRPPRRVALVRAGPGKRSGPATWASRSSCRSGWRPRC